MIEKKLCVFNFKVLKFTLSYVLMIYDYYHKRHNSTFYYYYIIVFQFNKMKNRKSEIFKNKFGILYSVEKDQIKFLFFPKLAYCI